MNVDSVVTVATRLAEAGHHGAERIAGVSLRLQGDWRALTAALEERSNTLAMATSFHQGAEQVITQQRGTCLMPVSTCLTSNLYTCLSCHDPPGYPHSPVCLSVQFLLRVEGWVQVCSEGALPSAATELEAATKKHQELNEEISANYTQVSINTCLSAYLYV